ncbi:MAG: aldehyde dehydrogenase [Bacteroidia bacterium]|nr:aldehyde dehydrogenase [Bacteroidia bacterium]MCF8425285.1 aldehyde dehydrogenase [Bacteroidia bacterium]MCF8446591.1 aldehyde dehydrogenase [Bacteroidia bacterium]
MQKILNYINGELIEPVSTNFIENTDPSTGEVYSLCPDSDAQDIELAYQAAEKAFPIWSETSANDRSKVMLKIADLIEKNLDELALAESIDQGKPLWLAKNGEIPRAQANIHFFATAIEHYASEAHPMGNHAINYTLRTPIGVVGCISPWNLPLYLFTWKIAPAIAAGNCVVAKPSEITPMTAYLFSKICMEAGLPKGVLNIVHGLGPKVGSAMVAHKNITAISFTGGTKTGAEIARVAAPMFKKLSLELGGKNPTLVFADCDFDKTVKEVVRASFTNQGEICLCGSRLYIERSIYEKFKTAFVGQVKALKVGDPLLPDTKVGAIASKMHFDKVLSYIELAKEEGGTILCGGVSTNPEGRCQTGYFIEPTVVEGLGHLCRTNQEEIFGPVVTIQAFDTEEEVLEMANSTDYGLACSVWTENLTKAHRVAAKMKSGIVWINCWLLRDLRTPFGGMKQSGVGREGGWEALRFFTEAKNVCIKM